MYQITQSFIDYLTANSCPYKYLGTVGRTPNGIWDCVQLRESGKNVAIIDVRFFFAADNSAVCALF